MVATVRRTLSVLALTLALMLGELIGPPVASAAPTDPLLAFPISNNIPRVMKAGNSYNVTVKFTNSGQQTENLKYRLSATCHASTKSIPFTTPWATVSVPSGGSTLRSTATVTVTLKVPAKCSPPAAVARTLLLYNASVFIMFGRASDPVSTYGGDPNNRYIYGPFTKTWYRFNLHARTDYPTLFGTYQAHHTMPQKHASKFKAKGINIHNPKYLRWWCSTKGVKTNHQSNSADYNKLWDAFFKKAPKASKAKILAFRTSIQSKFKYNCPAVP